MALAEEFKSDYDSKEDKAEMDSLIQACYVIVSMNGKYGIYDREKNDSVTAMDMDYIEYSRYFQLLLPGKMTIFASGYIFFATAKMTKRADTSHEVSALIYYASKSLTGQQYLKIESFEGP